MTEGISLAETINKKQISQLIPIRIDNDWFKPRFAIKCNGIFFKDVENLTIENNMLYNFTKDTQGNRGTTGNTSLTNTTTMTVPNDDGVSWMFFNIDDTIEVWGDYLQTNEEQKENKIINTKTGATRTMQKLFKGYIFDIIPKSDSGGNSVSIDCRNSVFKWKWEICKEKTYGGRQGATEEYMGDALNRFMNDNHLDTSLIDKSRMRNALVNVNTKDKDCYTALNTFRENSAHASYVNEEDKVVFFPVEDLFVTKQVRYWEFRYGENIISCSAPSREKRVNKVIVYFGANFDAHNKCVVYDRDNIANQGKEYVKTFVKRGIGTYNDAYAFAVAQLLSYSTGANLEVETLFFPYIKVGDFFSVYNPYLGVDTINTASKVVHSFSNSGARTKISGFGTIINALDERLVKERRRTLLGYEGFGESGVERGK